MNSMHFSILKISYKVLSVLSSCAIGYLFTDIHPQTRAKVYRRALQVRKITSDCTTWMSIDHLGHGHRSVMMDPYAVDKGMKLTPCIQSKFKSKPSKLLRT